VYFLHGFRLADADFIPRDWYTWNVFHYHFAFGYLLFLLQKIGQFPVAVLVAHVVMRIIFALGLFLICKRLCKNYVAVFLLTVAWWGLARESEMGLVGAQLLSSYFQPADVAAGFIALGFGLLFWSRFLWAGLFLGLAGLFHGAYLSSYGPAILVAALAMGVWRNRRTLFQFAIPIGILWGMVVVVVFAAVSLRSSVPASTLSIITNIRCPGDFIITNWPVYATVNWLLWAGIGLAGVLAAPDGMEYRALRAGYFAALATTAIGIVQIVFLPVPSLSLLMLWRCTPLMLLLGIPPALDYLIDILNGTRKITGTSVLFVATVGILGFVLSARGWKAGVHGILLAAVPIGAMAAAGIKYFLERVKKGYISFSRAGVAASIVSLMMVYIMVYYSGQVFHYNQLTLSKALSVHKLSPESEGMVAWIKSNTPDDAVFVVPPVVDFMRLRAKRALVVDDKASCALPSDLKEWFARLCDASGLTTAECTSSARIVNGYNKMDEGRALALNRKYGADYALLLTKDHRGDLSGLAEVFSNDEYRIVKIAVY
jgi:hypothetical protein